MRKVRVEPQPEHMPDGLQPQPLQPSPASSAQSGAQATLGFNTAVAVLHEGAAAAVPNPNEATMTVRSGHSVQASSGGGYGNSSNMCPLPQQQQQQVTPDAFALVVIIIIIIIVVVVIVVVIVVRQRRRRLECSPAGQVSSRRLVSISSIPLFREPFDKDTSSSRTVASAQLESDHEEGTSVANEHVEAEAQAHDSSRRLPPIAQWKSFDDDATQSLSPAPAERALFGRRSFWLTAAASGSRQA